MTEITGTAAAGFSASHVIAGHPRCGRIHGHRWRISVTIRAGQDPTNGEVVGLPELATAVEQFCAELDREDLGAMLPGAKQTPIGVAYAVRERLALSFRTITEVTVWMDDIASTLHG